MSLCLNASMEECDALCTKIAIMVNGRLRCLGTPQHLKSKFGDGYTLMAKTSGTVSELCHFIESRFPGSLLKDFHHGQVHYHVPRSPEVTLAELFGSLEEVRDRLGVEDYSVSQTTLEQIFVNFARSQRPPSEHRKVSCCHWLRRCLCQCC